MKNSSPQFSRLAKKSSACLMVLFGLFTQVKAQDSSQNILSYKNTLNKYNDKLEQNTTNTPDAPQLTFDLHGDYDRPVQKAALEKAKLLSDFVAGYPVNWIDEYLTTELVLSNKGKPLKAMGNDNKLSADQKNLLLKAEVGTLLSLNVKYRQKNAVTGVMYPGEMKLELNVVPAVEAQYPSGMVPMRAYIIDKVIDKFPKIDWNMNEALARFTINEQGEVINTQMGKTTGNKTADQLVLDALNKMPKWKVARNAQGQAIKQDFILKLNYGTAGC